MNRVKKSIIIIKTRRMSRAMILLAKNERKVKPECIFFNFTFI